MFWFQLLERLSIVRHNTSPPTTDFAAQFIGLENSQVNRFGLRVATSFVHAIFLQLLLSCHRQTLLQDYIDDATVHFR